MIYIYIMSIQWNDLEPVLDKQTSEFTDFDVQDSIRVMDECSQIQVTMLDIMYSITIEAEHIDECIFLVYRQNVFLKLNKKLVQPGVWSFFFTNTNGFPLLFIQAGYELCFAYLQLYNSKNITKITFHGADFTKRGQVFKFFKTIPVLEVDESIKLTNYSKMGVITVKK